MEGNKQSGFTGLRLVIFDLFINDLELGLSSVVNKFANDTKSFRRVKTKVHCKELQEGISKWDAWATTKQMKFSVGRYKSKIMHIGTKKIPDIYADGV